MQEAVLLLGGRGGHEDHRAVAGHPEEGPVGTRAVLDAGLPEVVVPTAGPNWRSNPNVNRKRATTVARSDGYGWHVSNHETTLAVRSTSYRTD